jgi:hypothetical protein
MATSLTIDRSSLRQLAAAMAIVMMIASLPRIGVIVIADNSGPTISMDICHPLQSLGTSPGAVPLARPAMPEFGAKILANETATQAVPVAIDRFAETPDPPPPKSFC